MDKPTGLSPFWAFSKPRRPRETSHRVVGALQEAEGFFMDQSICFICRGCKHSITFGENEPDLYYRKLRNLFNRIKE